MRTFFFLALTVPLLVPGSSWTLTIYRIGGADRAPPPEAALEGVEFVPLSWEAAAQGFDGKMQGLALEEAGIAPVLVSPDDNLALSAPARGGGPAGFAIKRGRNIYGALVADKLVDKIADGDPTTAFRLVDDQGLARFSYASPGTFLIDLGWRFPINRIRFYPTPQYSGRNVEEFAVQVVEGSSTGAIGSRTANWQKIFNALFPDGTRRQWVAGAPRDEWTIDAVGSVSPNRQRAVDFLFPTRTVEYVALTVAAQEMWEVAELEVYGEGYVPRAFYQSQVLDLGAVSTLGTLRWTGFKDDDAHVEIRTRSGSDLDPDRYWRFTGRGDEQTFLDDEGQPLTRTAYQSLSFGQGPITPDLDHWSDWSGGYSFADSLGTPMTSPGPQRFVQLQVAFATKDGQAGGLELVELLTSQPPISGPVVAEVWPVAVEPGQVTNFVYALRPELGRETSGFDQLVLETSGRFVGVDSVRINQERQALVLAEPLQDQRLVVALPRLGPADNQKVVELFFRAQSFHFGTWFHGAVFDSERPLEVGQRVEAGDALFQLEGNQVWVGIQLDGGLLQQVGVETPVITPNGDGINDVVAIEYTVLKLAQAGTVEVAVFDISGRRVQQLYRGQDRSGRYGRWWDGRDADGQVVGPGLYVYRVRVAADQGWEQRSGLIIVAY